MGTLTIIAYRKNRVDCSLGFLSDQSHDSELTVRAFRHDSPEIDTFLEMSLLDDMRKKKENPKLQAIELSFLVDGTPIDGKLMARRLDRAEEVAERMFEAEQAAERRALEAARREREEAAAKAARFRDITELNRILNTYPVQELRDAIQDFRL